MALLIDGYNLLNSVGITGRPGRGTSLKRSRTALLNFLVATLDPAELRQTTVVFDAIDAPPGLPRTAGHHGISVRFAARHSDADSLIEELVKAHSSPRRLTVVSSDHRVQRAARRRRARAVDSDLWYMEIVRQRRRRERPPPAPVRKPGPLSEMEVEEWLARFGGNDLLDEVLAEEQAGQESPAQRAPQETHGEIAGIDNPFPPGYAEDLLAADPIEPLFPDEDEPRKQ